MQTNFYIGNNREIIDNKIAEAEEANLVKRIWDKDYTLWSDSPDEITNRLGWLDISLRMERVLGEINDFTDSVRNDFDFVVLLGMGGSSLSPDVFSKVFGSKLGFPKLLVADSTHPDFVESLSNEIEITKTLFVVSTKSGGTAETMSLMKYFYNKLKGFTEDVGNHFVAITDPGSGLEQLSNNLHFRKTFLNDPNIGGRFSALSYFGLVPAAISGVDVKKLLQKANSSICQPNAESCLSLTNNEAAKAGVIIGELANNNINKLTFFTSQSLANYGDWVEQLIAESTGKIGKGILPVVGDEANLVTTFGKDRVIVVIRVNGDEFPNGIINSLKENNFTVIEQILDDEYEVGALMYFWEFATAVAGWAMELHPFDQPDVESAKVAARNVIKQFSETGVLPEPETLSLSDDIKICSTTGGDSLETMFQNFTDLLKGKSNPYISIHCYSNYEESIIEALAELKNKLSQEFNIPVTIGFGPRFLHSTGQLHKGDSGQGIFLQLFKTPSTEIQIPDEAGKEESSITFNVLVKAQSLGDRQALIDKGRDVLRIETSKMDDLVKKLIQLI